MTSSTRWGILGTGKIARRMAETLSHVPDAELLAVGSRTQAGADSFGGAFGVPRRYQGYGALLADPDIDVVYIGTPHPLHRRDVLACFEAGKHVLCEKPLTINAREAQDLVDAARAHRLFLMEAHWTHFFPIMERARALLAEGAIGEPRYLSVNFTWHSEVLPESRFFKHELGGGVLLDLGVYGFALAWDVFGPPDHAVGLPVIGSTGVDFQSGYVLSYDAGGLAVIGVSQVTADVKDAAISGTHGRIVIHEPWYKPQRMTVSRRGQPDEVIEMPYPGTGQEFEVQEVQRCLRAGLIESPGMPLDQSVAMLALCDEIRAAWGLVYPSEED